MKKVICSIVSALTGGFVGAGLGALKTGQIMAREIVQKNAESDKFYALFMLMNQWVKVKQEGKKVSEYFEKRGYRNIAIYGMSDVGETLLSELKGTNTKVMYGIDKNATSLYSDIEIVSPVENLEQVDVIVVTAITFFDEIREELRRKVNCDIISLKDVIYEI